MTAFKPSDSDIDRTLEFFRQAVPKPTDKNFSTQLGVHFEEVSEMVASLAGADRMTQALLTAVLTSTHALALHLKTGDGTSIRVLDSFEFLDGLCDQIVTAAGCAHMLDMDMAGALGEVNRSNLSKFDENGKAILDDNQKVIKGPNYFKPNLTPFTKSA